MIHRAVVYALLAELGASVSMIATFRLATDNWGVTGFAEWIMSRRLIAFMVPVMTAGLDIGLVRTLARSSRADGGCSEPAALLILAVTGSLVGAVMLLVPAPIADLVFGSEKQAGLILPILCVSLAYSLHVVYYAGLRGRARYMLANFAHVAVYGVIPLAMIVMFHYSITTTLLATAVSVFVMSSVSIYINTGLTWPTRARLYEEVWSLLAYSVPRMAAALLLIALTLLPASMAATYSGLETAGLVALALSVVGIAATASAPIQVVLLPTASTMWSEGRQKQLLAGLRKLEIVVTVLGVAAIVLMPLAAPFISVIILGTDDPLLRRALAISAVAIGPFVYFVCGRQVVDACTTQPLNTFNLLIALAAFFICVVGLRGLSLSAVDVIVGSYVLAVLVLAAMTHIVIHRLFRHRSQPPPLTLLQ